MRSSKLPKQKILVILGPTASGKSDLAVKLAKKFNGEIISADSRQVYKGLDIGSGKITKKEMLGIRHHLLDVAEPKAKGGKRFTVDNFKKLAEKVLIDIESRGKFAIICGGTGFYIQAIVDDITLPDVSPNKALRKKLGKLSAKDLFIVLKKLDPGRAETVEKQNPARLIRAIEIAKTLGKVPKLDELKNKENDRTFLQIGISIDPTKLKKKIEKRLIARMKKGMLKEAKDLHKAGLSWKRMEELGLEYRYQALYLQGKISKEDMLKKINSETWHYAKRQMTWFKRDSKIKWFALAESRKIEATVRDTFLQKA